MRGLDFVDVVQYFYLILWNLIMWLPIRRETRFIDQSTFFFEVFKYFNERGRDVKIEFSDLDYSLNSRKFNLIVKNRRELFYRLFSAEEVQHIIKELFFSEENLTVEAAFCAKNFNINPSFEISVKFNEE
ncbi:MAG: hypothetical protein ACQERB_06350 [Promethearchaeati archaeon]